MLHDERLITAKKKKKTCDCQTSQVGCQVVGGTPQEEAGSPGRDGSQREAIICSAVFSPAL